MPPKAKPLQVAGPPRSRRPAKPPTGDSLFPGSVYSEEELEFLRAIEAYKRLNRRPWPTFTEVLSVAKSLGYRKVAPKERRARKLTIFPGPQSQGKSP